MSVRIMAQIWERSEQTGTELLMLLAIADHANDDGLCWPSIARLARKARVSERHARRIISDLIAAGELSADRRGGLNHTSKYQISERYLLSERGTWASPLSAKDDTGVPLSESQRRTRTSERRTRTSGKEDIAMSSEPSVTIIEPSGTTTSTAEPEIPERDPELAEVISGFESRLGLLTPTTLDRLLRLWSEITSPGPYRDAFREADKAIAAGKSVQFGYIEAIVRRITAQKYVEVPDATLSGQTDCSADAPRNTRGAGPGPAGRMSGHVRGR